MTIAQFLGHILFPPTSPPPHFVQTPEGETGSWGNSDLDTLYGPKGWCMAENALRE